MHTKDIYVIVRKGKNPKIISARNTLQAAEIARDMLNDLQAITRHTYEIQQVPLVSLTGE